MPKIYKLNEKRLVLIKAFYGVRADVFKCTFTRVRLEVKVRSERVREYTRTVAKWTGSLGQADLFAEILGMNCVTVKIKGAARIEDVFLDKLVIKKFGSDWMCVGVEDVPF